jgi:metacaspase-1
MPEVQLARKETHMPIGRALAIGIDSPKRGVYRALGSLTVAEADARYLAALARSRGFATKSLLGPEATRAAVVARISAAAQALAPGDIFLLSFSGHGDRVPDRNRDDPDRRDEAWCLYDGRLVDDRLPRLWARFKPRVRIVVISDSCYSGRITRLEGPRHPKVEATVLLISACQETQQAFEDRSNSVFVKALKKVWNRGRFQGTYKGLWKGIRSEMASPRQQPNYLVVGARDAAFERQRPFTI